MSLTRMLAKKDLPLRQWFETRLPDISVVTKAWVAAGPSTSRPPEGVNAGMIGQAIDYRIRFLFDLGPVDELFATRMSPVFAGGCESATILSLLGQRYTTAASTSSTVGGVQPEGVEREWAAICYLLACCDAHGRTTTMHSSVFDVLPADATRDDLDALDVRFEPNIRVVAQELGATQRTVYGFINRGELQAHQMGRVIRVRRAALDDYLDRSKINPGDLDHLCGGPETDHPDAEDESSAG